MQETGKDENQSATQASALAASSTAAFSLHPSSFPLRLSQTQLNLLSTCPRKFQHVYLEQLAAPADVEQQERQTQGSQFHLLMQQWHLSLPIEAIVQENVQLQRWFTAFVNAAPQILDLDRGDEATLRQSEHARTLEFDGYLLTVIYDLLITNQQQAKILDWKTYARPQNSQWLLQNWQTRLYPFVLVETSDYRPEQISMVYWFFQSQREVGEAQSLVIAYDREKHEQTRQDLTNLLDQLTTWLHNYLAGHPFPQVALGAKECEACSFAVKCDREALSMDYRAALEKESQASLLNSSSLPLPDFADIQEVPL